jgi:hypothetical protein
VRIVERSNKKQRATFIKRDELAWLVGSVEVVIEVETSEVFWDQSRVGYPHIIAQKCSNRHGRFLTIEEFDGRRRRGTILIMEGQYGQGWARLIAELRLASSSLREGHEVKASKVAKEVSGRWSFVEVVGLAKSQEEESFYTYKESIARVPRWLKEASTALEGQVPASSCGGREKVLAKTHL